GWSFENKLVMHLQQHARLHVALVEQPLNPDHGDFDEIGGSALQRRVYGRPLRKTTGSRIAAVHIRNRSNAAEQRFGDAGFANFGDGPVEEFANAGITLEIAADVQFRFLAVDAELLRQPERRLAVDDTKVDGLRSAAHFRGDHDEIDMKHLGSRSRVDVFTARE